MCRASRFSFGLLRELEEALDFSVKGGLQASGKEDKEVCLRVWCVLSL